ncbi:hypothetical protein [Nocardioides sp. LHG3406-4]|uniref:hypothetical protein n=1 Tax=Nocardioides sp. LHG3406-4 TaxID=2804575 RepID=UPI003CE92D89
MTHERTADDPSAADDTAAGGQVSEVSGLDPDGPDPISPSDATAGSPDAESGRPQEGTAGPDAPPRHGIPEESNESSR